MARKRTATRGARAGLLSLGILVLASSACARPGPTEGRAEPGDVIPDFSFTDLREQEGSLDDLLAGRTAVVIVLRTSECPVSRKYGHRLARMEKRFDSLDVGLAHLNVSPHETPEKMQVDVETFGFEGPYLVDPGGEIGELLDARVSTEVFLVDSTRTLRYRGAVDDQYGIDFAKPQPRETYLGDAVAALVAGAEIEVPRTRASGCFLTVEHRHPETHSTADR